ncbi:hypothetical protein VDGL01_10997 [Verticillium dahliae]
MTKDENGRGSPGGSLPRALMTLPKSPGCSSCRSPDQRHGRRLWAHAAGAPRTELDGGHWFSRFENQREMDRLVALEDNRSHYGRHENVAWRPPGPTKYAFSVQDTVARGLGRDGDVPVPVPGWALFAHPLSRPSAPSVGATSPAAPPALVVPVPQVQLELLLFLLQRAPRPVSNATACSALAATAGHPPPSPITSPSPPLAFLLFFLLFY